MAEEVVSMFEDAKVFSPIVWDKVKGVKVSGLDKEGNVHDGELYLLKDYDADQLHLYGINPVNEVKITEIQEISGAAAGEPNSLTLELIY
ncbi:hypothetical protein vBBak6_007 [Bacillus phage v_B-Bak6]|uniref:Uncharacterized protein n=1 Tax=Bacillus phage v_B-Bak10 TaxID=2094736 RepID=A0A385IK59_9CAUD|nr:hypothetical protein PP654_gp013 [Bacillus phage v_B-Bak10]AXY82969.1 hypothetical protein vBBak1_007 [Bacillus phage v_B-Bak1]AXY83089.1 hypothetical protein vBBak6_007 [Bacillus phage v_B-Bak6]AXY83276.1 hypothetical protein vBBBak10_013 [Bacillus phage v_B-Bak10]